MPKLSESQNALLAQVGDAFRLPPTAQVRYFWRCLRKHLLPDMPQPEKGQSASAYALAQLRWQRIAALSQDSHVAAGQLLREEIALVRQMEESGGNQSTLTAAQAEEQLSQLIENAPRGVQWRLFAQIGERNPSFLAQLTGQGSEDEDESDEADDDSPSKPASTPKASLVAVPGGKK